MATQKVSAPGARRHIVLVPGFGGFDALGQVEYYSGITRLFQQWQARHPGLPVVLHYFDNLPTAAVTTRAARLRTYLAKRMARGEILKTDKIVLVGHSTGGLDIRQLICDLPSDREADRLIRVDGGCPVSARAMRHCLDGVVFLSVPHWGTNIADWVYSHAILRKTAIADLRAAFAGSQVYLLDEIEAGIARGAFAFTGADLLLAWRDALTEANDRMAGPDPTAIAAAQEAASELELYFRQMTSDFRVIDDLTSQPHEGGKSPAHFDDHERERELDRWKHPPIRTLSYATLGGRPFSFSSPSGCAAPTFELTNPCDYPQIVNACGQSPGTDISYRLCYRACAGGPLKWQRQAGDIARVLGPLPPEPIELWDNDGIVNTVSMLWPKGSETVLVVADHLDIVGHFRLRRAHPGLAGGSKSPRTYQSYDSLRSAPLLTERIFKDVWTEIFYFAGIPGTFDRNRKSQPRPVALARPVPSAVPSK